VGSLAAGFPAAATGADFFASVFSANAAALASSCAGSSPSSSTRRSKGLRVAMDDGGSQVTLRSLAVWGTGELTLLTNLSCRYAASPWLDPRWRSPVAAAAAGGWRRRLERGGRPSGLGETSVCEKTKKP